MKEQIEKRIAELQAQGDALDKEVQGAQAFVQKSTAQLNALQGAIAELNNLIKPEHAETPVLKKVKK